jgi:hypothetical protein
MINLLARSESDIKNNIYNITYDKYYLGYDQHIQYMYKSKIFRPYFIFS